MAHENRPFEKLNAKQRRFCDEYLIDLNGKQAVIRAGYSEVGASSTAVRLLANPSIKKYIEEQMSQRHKDTIASQNEILEYLTSVMRREQKEHIVGNNGSITEIPAKLSDANKACEMLCRRYALFTDNVDIKNPIPVIIKGEDDIHD